MSVKCPAHFILLDLTTLILEKKNHDHTVLKHPLYSSLLVEDQVLSQCDSLYMTGNLFCGFVVLWA